MLDILLFFRISSRKKSVNSRKSSANKNPETEDKVDDEDILKSQDIATDREGKKKPNHRKKWISAVKTHRKIESTRSLGNSSGKLRNSTRVRDQVQSLNIGPKESMNEKPVKLSMTGSSGLNLSKGLSDLVKSAMVQHNIGDADKWDSRLFSGEDSEITTSTGNRISKYWARFFMHGQFWIER